MGRNYTLHAFDRTDIDPTRYGPVIKAYAFMAVIIGARGSNTGVLLAGFTLVLFVEGSRFLVDAFGLRMAPVLQPCACPWSASPWSGS